MKTNDRYNIHNLKGNMIGYLRVIDKERVEIYDNDGDHTQYGSFVDENRFNIYELLGKQIGYGKVVDSSRFDLYDQKGDHYGYGTIV